MTLNQILKHVVNSGGITLTKDMKHFKDSFGYMVAVEGHEIRISLNSPHFTKEVGIALRDLASKAWTGTFVGLWIYNDYLYLDVSEYFSNYEASILTASKRNQIAIFDLYSKESINVNEALKQLA